MLAHHPYTEFRNPDRAVGRFFCRQLFAMALTHPDAVNPLYGSTIHFPREGRLTCFTSNYLLNASNGDRRDAFQAEYTPAAKLKNRGSNQTQEIIWIEDWGK
ncbi:MAG TPA: hypothetical protein VH500_01805 [Nitrososphaeraceae archaeon]